MLSSVFIRAPVPTIVGCCHCHASQYVWCSLGNNPSCFCVKHFSWNHAKYFLPWCHQTIKCFTTWFGMIWCEKGLPGYPITQTCEKYKRLLSHATASTWYILVNHILKTLIQEIMQIIILKHYSELLFRCQVVLFALPRGRKVFLFQLFTPPTFRLEDKITPHLSVQLRIKDFIKHPKLAYCYIHTNTHANSQQQLVRV